MGLIARAGTPLLPTRFDIDLEAFPILMVTFPVRVPGRDVEDHFRNVETIFRERGPFLLIADINRLAPSEGTAKQRERFAAGSDHLARIGAFLGEAVVASSPLTRGLVTAYSWLRRAKNHPFTCVSRRTEALLWAGQVLADDALARHEPSRWQTL